MNAVVEDPPDVPPEVDHVVEWFWELSNRRPEGMSGPRLIPWSDLQAWLALTPNYVERGEVDMLCAMDHAYVDQLRIEREARRAREKDAEERDKQRKHARGKR